MPDREDERDRLEAEVNRWHAEATSAQMESVRRRAETDTLRARVRYLESMQRSFLMCLDSLAHAFPEANRQKVLAWIQDTALVRDALTTARRSRSSAHPGQGEES